MNLIDEFLEQNLSRDLNHQLLSQIQQQNSAVQCLVSNLQSLRSESHLQAVPNKINRIESFMQLKKQVATTFQPLNKNSSAIFDWILNNLIHNTFLYELIKREELFVQKQLIEISKKTLLEDNFLQQHHEDIEFANKLVRNLQLLNQEKSQTTKLMNREKVKEVDHGMELFEEKIKMFDQKVSKFNTQVILFLRKIYEFDQKMKNEFYHHFKSSHDNPQSPPSIQSNVQNNHTRQHSQKSHISINSQNHESRKQMSKHQQFYENQPTPRKFLDTEAFEPVQRSKIESRKSVIDKKRLTLDDKRSSVQNQDEMNSFQENGGSMFEKRSSTIQQRGSMIENRGSVIQKKRSSIDYNNRRVYQTLNMNELKNMNKTLSTLNYYRPETSNMLYTTNNFGQQVRLPTGWAINSRSSLSYFAPR